VQVAQISVALRVHVVLLETDCIFTKELIRGKDLYALLLYLGCIVSVFPIVVVMLF
jgi:hypothetical protein